MRDSIKFIPGYKLQNWQLNIICNSFPKNFTQYNLEGVYFLLSIANVSYKLIQDGIRSNEIKSPVMRKTTWKRFQFQMLYFQTCSARYSPLCL